MKTKIQNWMRRIAGVSALALIFTSFAGQASARILFQDDTTGTIESENLNIGSNDAGANNTSIKFGADSTASENGNINWNITTNTFEIDHTTAITGGLSATGAVNFSGATSTRIREVANEAVAACTSVGEIVLDTGENKIYVCTVIGAPGTWTSTTPSSSDFEAVYAADVDKILTTGNGAFTIAAGSGAVNVNSTNAAGVSINNNVNGAVNIATGTSTGAVSIGGGSGTVAIDSSDWDISTTGAMTGISGITNDSTLTTSGGAVNVNASSNFATNINTGTSTGAVSIGGGSGTVAIDSTSWDISTAGVASGLTGLTSTGTVNFSGAGAFRVREVAGITNPGTPCTTTGELIMDTSDNTLYVCNNAGTDAWSKVSSGGDATTLDTLDSTQFLRSDTSDNFTSGTLTLDSGTTLTVNGIATIGDNGDTVAINSSDWDISTTGAMTGISGITNDNTFTTSGGAVNVNASSNFATNINTGTSTGAVSIGGGSGTVAIDSSAWDISAAGAASGFTTIDASGNITTSAGTFCVGTTCLNETNAAGDNGATLVGTFDEFDNSNSTNVQDVLDDLDSKIGPNAPNVNELNFYPEYPDVVVFRDGATNNGTLVSDYDSTNRRQYYGWTSSRASLQDIDLRFRYELPSDWVATGDLTLQLRTLTNASADNAVDILLRNDTDNTTCATSSTNVSSVANTWETVTVTAATINAGCSGGNALAAGDIIEIQIKNYAKNTGASDVGRVNLDYTN